MSQKILSFKPNLSPNYSASLYFKTALYFIQEEEKKNNNFSPNDGTIYHSYRITPPSIMAVSVYIIKQNKSSKNKGRILSSYYHTIILQNVDT